MKSKLFILLCLSLTTVFAFVHPLASTNHRSTTTTSLASRKWNFNEGQGPFGLKNNAEIWNGRVAMMCFTEVLLQELIQGKGVVEGLQQGDAVNVAFAAITVVSILGLTGFLAMKGADSYVDRELGKK